MSKVNQAPPGDPEAAFVFLGGLVSSLICRVVLVLMVLMALPAFAKRVPPPEVPDLKSRGVVYSHGHEEIDGGYACFLSAKKLASKRVMWKTRLFDLRYDQNLETDVQDVFLVSLKLSGGVLVAKDEAGHVFKVDAKSGRLISPAKPVRIDKIL